MRQKVTFFLAVGTALVAVVMMAIVSLVIVLAACMPRNTANPPEKIHVNR